MIIKYGILNNNIDVTSICHTRLKKNDIIIIPSGEYQRASYFTDPLYGTVKSIFIINNNVTTEYDQSKVIYIDIIQNKVLVDNIPDHIRLLNTDEKTKDIHSKLKLRHGLFEHELSEQKMSVRYLTGNEKVLEIGGNIGRNSLIIGYILNQQNNNNLVVLESDTDIFNQLNENIKLNNMKFHIENAALSKRKLIQKEWDTIPSNVLLDGYKNVNIISYNELVNKYNIQFDTLVLDCEGAFYYILQDMPEVLNNIKLIIMENDYHNINHKIYIDNMLKSNNFYVDYSEAGGWGPCFNNFWEVWKKLI